MAYLTGARTTREAAATLWVMLVGAGLLATSPPEDGGDPVPPVWSGPGPAVTLTDAEPARAFAVTVLVPELEEGVWANPEFARISLSVSADHDASSGGTGAAGQAGASSVPSGENPPWSTVALHDSSGMTLLESTAFLTTWGGYTDVAFSGECDAPDPTGADPCRLSFTVEFERSPTGSSSETALDWSLNISANSGAQPDAVWTAEIEPL